MEFHEYPDRDMMMLRVAQRIASELGETLRAADRATLSVPGGTTPGPVFDTLSGADLDWSRVSVMLNDERWVPEDNPPVEHRAAAQTPADGPPRADAKLVPLYARAPRPRRCAGRAVRRYSAAFAHFGAAAGDGCGYAHGKPVSRRRQAGASHGR